MRPSTRLLTAFTFASGVAALCFGGTARAFTNGTLIPSYLCDLEDLRIGSPASLGAVVPLLVEDAANAMALIAGYHKKAAAPYTAQDLCTASIATANQADVTATTQFIVSTKTTTDQLLGLVAWVQDLPAAGLPRRIGTITTPGLNMIYYPYRGCGSIGQTIVHSTALDDDAAVKSQSAPFTWNLGTDGVSGTAVMVRGVCITRMGYGPFAVSLTANAAIANTFTGGTNYDGSGKGTCALTTATNAAKATASTTATAATTTAAATSKAMTTLTTKATAATSTTAAATTSTTKAAATTATSILNSGASQTTAPAPVSLAAVLAAMGVAALFL
ncbi:hypothetical protein HK405_006055 [Cladochytrium tenue]|nr:hypothetical protein HK405_006055 [Cladochytrium tenue]